MIYYFASIIKMLLRFKRVIQYLIILIQYENENISRYYIREKFIASIIIINRVDNDDDIIINNETLLKLSELRVIFV